MTSLLIATKNAHKVQEIRQILGEGFAYVTLNDCPGAPAIIEDAETFEGNARKKSEGLAQWLAANMSKTSKLVGPWKGRAFVLADDSGLEVDALGGRPGVHSARFAAVDAHSGNTPDSDNNAKLLKLLVDVPAERRTARFRCVIALTELAFTPEGVATLGSTCFASGTCEGHIAFGPSGKGGFGYDPLFIPSGHTASFAELGESVKNTLSHRARALERLRSLL
jgi:XTP/dITP diphosphohydrolase